MPKGKLKGALIAHQAASARAAAKKKAESASVARRDAIERSLRTNGKKPKRPTTHAGPSTLASSATSLGGGRSKAGGSAKGKRKATVPFDKNDTILLLGEANFSFALSLLLHHHHPPSRLCATSYDSEDVCFRKYPDAEDHVRQLREQGVRVEFGVDAGTLEKYKWIGKGRWSRIIFNFPHAGAGITDQDRNILTNQILLLRTFRSVAPILTSGPSRFPLPSSSNGRTQGKAKRKKTPEIDDGLAYSKPNFELDSEDGDEDADDHGDMDNALILGNARSTDNTPPPREGTILITLLDQPPYSLWDLRRLAIRPPASIPSDPNTSPTRRYRLLRSFDFQASVYPGYAHRRTIGFKQGVSKERNEEIEGRKGGARTWEFALV